MSSTNPLHHRRVVRAISELAVTTLLVVLLQVQFCSPVCHEPVRLDPKIDRVLTVREIAEIARLSDLLISREPREDPYSEAGQGPTVQIPHGNIYSLDREIAATELGRHAHVYCRPALLAVLRDAGAEGSMRLRCLTALCQTRYRGVFDYLIVMLTDHDVSIVGESFRLVKVLIGKQVEFEFDIYGSVELRKHQADKITKWWNENRDRATLHFEFTGLIP